MLSEESFPRDFDKFDDAFIDSKNESRTSHSSENVSEEFFMGNSVSMNSMNSMDKLITKPVPPPRGRKVSNDPHGTSFSSNDSSFSSSRFPPIPPRAPTKTKKFQSCQDLFLNNNHPNLYQRSKRYAHVESKVKKLINEQRSEDRRRMLTRHKSMPESSQNPSLIEESLEDMDDLLYQDGDINVLKNELQRKTREINEMKEKSASDESKILMLEYDTTKMKMSIDSMRLEFTQYVEKLRNSKEVSSSTFSDISQYRSSRSVREIGIQTDCLTSPSNASTAILDADVSYLDAPKPTMHVRGKPIVDNDQEKLVRINEFAEQRYDNPLFRELTYNNMTEEDIINNQSIPNNSFNISAVSGNISSEHLISTIGNQHPSIPEGSSRPLKKKKKLKNRLLKFVPCVSRK